MTTTPDFRALAQELLQHARVAQKVLIGEGLWDDDEQDEGLFDRADAALATPPPEPLRPIPVSERLPGPGDCADELCWMWESDINGHEDLGHWLLEHRNWVSDPEADCTHWLPHNAIPFPEVTQ